MEGAGQRNGGNPEMIVVNRRACLKTPFLPKQPKFGGRKCLGKPRKSFVGFPSAKIFRPVLRESSFSTPKPGYIDYSWAHRFRVSE
jgi:hypothetical protein